MHNSAHALASPLAGACLDLAHLSRQTGGDLSLQHELLILFTARSAEIVAQIYALAGAPAQQRKQLCDLAHQLRGSALAIGTFDVATAAEAVERAFEPTSGPEIPAPLPGVSPEAALGELAAAHAEALSAIAAHVERLQAQLTD